MSNAVRKISFLKTFATYLRTQAQAQWAKRGFYRHLGLNEVESIP